MKNLLSYFSNFSIFCTQYNYSFACYGIIRYVAISNYYRYLSIIHWNEKKRVSLIQQTSENLRIFITIPDDAVTGETVVVLCIKYSGISKVEKLCFYNLIVIPQGNHVNY